ncbi:hypothetical protein FRC11_004069 [Ceratobasidium sp. 423]|nr:hypothetical protein FRC11_004069 [Ceratobasidium sp. 423]
MEVLDQAMSWGTGSGSDSKIYWINGTARSGKTTIAYTICSKLQSRKRLAASFFCSRSPPECRDVQRVIPTIAHQLTQFSHPFLRQLHQTLQNNPSVYMQDPATQFETLIREPIMAIKDTLTYDPVVVIDALEELDEAVGAQTILKPIFESAGKIPVKFLITSPLEDTRAPQVYHLQEVREKIIRADPPPHDLYQQPMDELYRSILSGEFDDSNRNAVEMKGIKLLLLWSAVCIQQPLDMTSLVRLLQLQGKQATLAWESLQFVLDVPERTTLITTPPPPFLDFIFSERSGDYTCDESTHHGLLAQRCFELMRDQLQFNVCKLDSSLNRDRDIRDRETKFNAVISEQLFYACRYWGAHLKMSAPNSSLMELLRVFITRQLLAWLEVLNLKQAVNLGVPMLATLKTWFHENNVLSDLIPLVHDAWKFVALLAAISARTSTPHIYISALAIWQPISPLSQVYGNLVRSLVAIDWITINYTRLFACENPDILPNYITSSLRAFFTNSPNTTIDLNDATGRRPMSLTKILWQNRSIRSIAVSTDNRSIMSASGNLAIIVWDRETGKGAAGPFHISNACFRPVAFSPDGKRIATGSSGRDIFIWDVSTGELAAGPFRGHRSWVAAIAFSPNGTRIVSGARDQLVLVWDICAPDAPIRIFEGHTGYVLSVAFSPQGSHVVSASTDKEVRVWDLQQSHPTPLLLIGHTDCVRSADVSPNGTHVISGSDDRTIRIWDMSTGTTVSGPLEGHSNYVLCVKFSPDGRHAVSGSQDCTVRVWDVTTGEVVAGPFKGHTSRINAVIFSADGTQVISGSDDGTIRVWDVQARNNTDTCIGDVSADPTAADIGTSEAWKLNADGWVVDKDERLLMWIPPQSHYAIRAPPRDHLLIPRLDLPISSLLEGKAWKELCRQQGDKNIKYET